MKNGRFSDAQIMGNLNQNIEWRDKLQVIRVDNGAEYVSGKLRNRACGSNKSSPANPSRTPISSATTAP